ncbi:MAG: hypothetical protein DMG40_17120 [Acidobacteria bacterium]|nr:MAG: hypothetical protein DMG40_17120 [Acidobacteriota bacterium]
MPLLLMIFAASSMMAVARSAPLQKKTSPAAVTQESKDIEAVRSELLELLRLSPKLTMAVSADPTLLADEAYVSRNNPELAEFLHSHPEVVRNPEFYLFFPNDFPGRGGRQGFQATVWPELRGTERTPIEVLNSQVIAFLVFVLILGALLWIFRIVLENKKWNKLHKMQTELFSKLLDRSSTNEELLASFRSSAGKPFFDWATIESRLGSPLSRVFLPLQFGIVLTLGGGGFLFLRHSGPPEHDAWPFLVLGTFAFTLGIGFIISAGVSYLLARHLGMLPGSAKAHETGTSD